MIPTTERVEPGSRFPERERLTRVMIPFTEKVEPKS